MSNLKRIYQEDGTFTDRQMTVAEHKQYDADQLADVARKDTALAATAAKASGVAKLAALGFTEAEIAAW